MVDKAVRDRAVQGLAAFLSRGTYVDEESGESSTGYVPLSDSEMAKLWKGLFYCRLRSMSASTGMS